MIELRWLGSKRNDWERVLQQRKMVWITRYADCDAVSEYPVKDAEAKWLAWEDVPVISAP